jgi:nicotinamide-nucleotide adenylyltransferase
MDERFHDYPRLRSLRRLVAAAHPGARPWVWLTDSNDLERTGGRIGVLSGSFNPPTAAHLALAERARAAANLDSVLLLLSRHTVDKAEISGLALEDRLLLMSLIGDRAGRCIAALTNRGLYADQAVAVRSTFRESDAVYFLVGFDKVVQIFDPHYYPDRDVALAELFGLASLLVAPRGTAELTDLAELLNQPSNRQYQSKVTALDIPSKLRDLSSTQVREAISAGQEWKSRVPEVVARFVEQTGAYSPPGIATGVGADRYGIRLALLSALETDDPAPTPTR